MSRLVRTLALALLIPSLLAAAEETRCTLCVGVTSDEGLAATRAVPLYLESSIPDLPRFGARVDLLTSDQRASATIVLSATLENESDTSEVEKLIGWTVDFARRHGPFHAVALDLENATPEVEAYAIKRFAVTLQGENLAQRIAAPPGDLRRLRSLYDAGSGAYFDLLVVPPETVSEIAGWLAENDPVKRIGTVVAAVDPNPIYDAARALADGASIAWVSTTAVDPAAVAAFNSSVAGDHSVDPSSTWSFRSASGEVMNHDAVAFVRGEDLRTVVVPRGIKSGAFILDLDAGAFENPRRIDGRGVTGITDRATRAGRTLVGIPSSDRGFALMLDRPVVTDDSVTRETMEIASERAMPVEEIIRRHQAYWSWQDTIEPAWIAENTTKLRFSVGPSSEAVEATLAGPYFNDPGRLADWVWRDFLINGVRWKYGRIPELPLVQPEKVTQLPLDIHLTNRYVYELVRPTTLDGFDVWEIRFVPPADAPSDLPLYRGTVWIDRKTFARVRIAMIQLNLGGEVLSNEERVSYTPFDRDSGKPVDVTAANEGDPRSLLWLPRSIDAQQVLSTAGRATVVQRATTLESFELSPSEFEARHREASRSDARMVRETEAGLRYLERTGEGERIVKQGYDTARVFLLGGIHHDPGLEFPVVPLGGIDYFNFDLWNKGLQTNVFFAGVMVAANLTDPSFRGTRTNLGADFFGIAIPFENTQFRGGSEIEGEAVKTLPVSLSTRVGHPILNFGKVDLSLGITHTSFQRAETTARGFEVPNDGFELLPAIDVRFDRRGWTLGSFYQHGIRPDWKPWGIPSEYSRDQETFARWGISIGKSFYLPKFQRIGIELDWLGGSDLDRFSKYELGFFGAQRVRGIKSGSVRAEEALLGHLSYGLVFSEQFRIEIFYDYASVDDAAAGLKRAPFQGVGLAGTTIGPWGTLLRLDIGKTVGPNAQDDFVANVVFLKLFG